VSALITDPERGPSVLADFDTGRVLDELSFGIVMLDDQLCTIYANAIAQNLLAVDAPGIRGRPLPQLLPRPGRFVWALRRALRTGGAVDYTLRMGFARWPDNADSINVRIAPLRNRMFGAYVLVEMSGQSWVRFRSSAGP
jgi:nitrogen-specific signal transduction histidine kinase